MPKYGPFIPKIKEKIYNVLKENELTPEFYFETENFYNTLKTQRFFIMPVTDKNGQKLIFKARIEDYPETKRIFELEIEFPKYLNKLKISDLTTCIVRESKNRPIEWYTYEFLETDSAGDTSGLQKKYYNTFPVKNILAALVSLQKNTEKIMSEKKFKKIRKKDGRKFVDTFDEFIHSMKNFIDKKTILRARTILTGHKKILDKFATKISHGDLHLGNIIINENFSPPVPIIIDWSNIEINNYVYDIAFLWTALSKTPKLQNELINEFIEISPEKENFDILFKLNLLITIPQIIDRFNYIKENSQENFDQQTKSLVKEFIKALNFK